MVSKSYFISVINLINEMNFSAFGFYNFTLLINVSNKQQSRLHYAVLWETIKSFLCCTPQRVATCDGGQVLVSLQPDSGS